jgi:FO synthase
MLESTAERLGAAGGPHDRAPDKAPRRRLRTIEAAGRLGIAFTTGILIGIGETRAERIEALLAIRELHARHGHIQEVIVQNFRAKPTIPMAAHPEPGLDELRRTIAVARLLLGPTMNVQAPPNLSPGTYPALIAAGLNDWGGISPLTIDHINPEAPWPHLTALERATAAAGGTLRERLAIYPEFIGRPGFVPERLRARVWSQVDETGLVPDAALAAATG